MLSTQKSSFVQFNTTRSAMRVQNLVLEMNNRTTWKQSMFSLFEKISFRKHLKTNVAHDK